MLQLHWWEGAATSQDFCGSVGARHLLLDQRPVWLQHLAEVELLLLTRILVRLNQLSLFLFWFFFFFFPDHVKTSFTSPRNKCLLWISWTLMSLIVFWIFQAHSDCHSCGLWHHLGSLPGCTLWDTVLTPWTPVLALQWMGCWITSYCVKRHYQDTETVLTKLYLLQYISFLFTNHLFLILMKCLQSRLTIWAYT